MGLSPSELLVNDNMNKTTSSPVSAATSTPRTMITSYKKDQQSRFHSSSTFKRMPRNDASILSSSPGTSISSASTSDAATHPATSLADVIDAAQAILLEEKRQYPSSAIGTAPSDGWFTDIRPVKKTVRQRSTPCSGSTTSPPRVPSTLPPLPLTAASSRCGPRRNKSSRSKTPPPSARFTYRGAGGRGGGEAAGSGAASPKRRVAVAPAAEEDRRWDNGLGGKQDTPQMTLRRPRNDLFPGELSPQAEQPPARARRFSFSELTDVSGLTDQDSFFREIDGNDGDHLPDVVDFEDWCCPPLEISCPSPEGGVVRGRDDYEEEDETTVALEIENDIYSLALQSGQTELDESNCCNSCSVRSPANISLASKSPTKSTNTSTTAATSTTAQQQAIIRVVSEPVFDLSHLHSSSLICPPLPQLAEEEDRFTSASSAWDDAYSSSSSGEDDDDWSEIGEYFEKVVFEGWFARMLEKQRGPRLSFLHDSST